MALTLGDNFSYQGAKPLDGRLKYDTLANMKAVADATMYDGCLAYCVATDKTYQWKSTNTVDTDTGRWREFSSGGGGGTSNYPDLTNKPSIEEIELVGNITADNLGLQKSSLSSSLKIDNVNRTTVQEALSALTTLTQPHEFTAFGNKSIDSDEYIPSVGNMEILYAKWETGSSPIPSPAFPLPNGWTTPLADMFYIIYMLRDKNDTYVDYECYAYYTYSSTNYVKLYARRATKSNDTWTFPSWIEVGGEDSKAYHTDDTSETTLADDDTVPFYDASASGKRKSTWSNIKSVLKSYFDTVYDLNKNDIPMYGTSSTGASTTAKTASVTRGTFTLVAGAKVSIKFTNTNTASAPTLNVGSTGAKNIKYIASDGTVTTPTTWWGAGEVVTFVYDGTQFLMMPTISMMPSLPVVGTINRSDIYDTTEKVIGCWTDGRPLYQKVVNFGTLPNATIKKVAHGISNLRRVVDIKGYICIPSTPWFTVIPTPSPSSNGGNNASLQFDADTTNINCTSAVDWSSSTECYVILKYTKTSDSANSYNYANENDYSTTEKIVGTWIDGSYLYQKTINFGALPNNTSKTVAHGISNLSYVVDITSTAKNSSGTTIQINHVATDDVGKGAGISVDSTNVKIITAQDRSSFTTCYVTFKYIKTTG